MDNFFIEFRDPLFGIIVFFLLIFVITFVSYWWGRYRFKRSSQDLDNFLQSFHSLETENDLTVLIKKGELSQKSWLLLANSYFKSADYDKSIEIYSEILKNSDPSSAQETMFLLGKTYFKAGFLERSKQMFLEILKHNPRTPEALEHLLLVYENLRDYKSALEVLEPLQQLNEEISKDYNYIELLSIINNFKIKDEIKIASILEIYKKTDALRYMIFEYLFRTDTKVAWENLDIDKSESFINILWLIDKKDLNFDIILQSDFLKELYTARGDIDIAKKSSIFELDILINLKKNANATLNFEYLCNSCQHSHPFAFNRCNYCHSIDTQIVEFSLTRDFYKNFNEENNSFQ